MASQEDLSHLPIRAQLALQRFERIASAQKTRLAAYLKAQPMTVGRSTRHEVILNHIKNNIASQSALHSRVKQHLADLQQILGPEKVDTSQEPKASAAPSARKRTSAGE